MRPSRSTQGFTAEASADAVLAELKGKPAWETVDIVPSKAEYIDTNTIDANVTGGLQKIQEASN
jgi:hypothetical protein